MPLTELRKLKVKTVGLVDAGAIDRTFAIVNDSRYVLDATYVLTLNHSRPDAETRVQGRLQWVVDQSQEGLWSLSEWTDQELGLSASWSDLKAVFIE